MSLLWNAQSGSKVTLQTIALENTSIKVGPARKTKHKGKMARRSKKSKRRDNYDRWESEVWFPLTLCSSAVLLISRLLCDAGNRWMSEKNFQNSALCLPLVLHTVE